MSSQKEVLIIGAGAIGCSIAYHLARQGVPSQIIERDSIGARASGKSWAIWSYPPHLLAVSGVEAEPSVERWPMPSIECWIELFWMGYHRLPDMALELKEKGGVDIGYGELPFIFVTESETYVSRLKEHLSFIRNAGYYEGNWLDADDLRAIFPDINPQVRGGQSFPNLQVEPYEYTLGLAQAAEKMGASIRQGEVVGFRHEGSKVTSVILATGTEVEADVVVLAMGPWSGQGTSRLGKEIPIEVHREQCIRVEVPERLPNYGFWASGGAICPKVNGTVILHGFKNLPDLQPGFDSSLTEEAKAAAMEAAISLLPRLEEAKIVEHRGDLEGWALNQMKPVLGLLPEWDNAYIAARMGTFGMMLSLGVGQVMADLIVAGGRPPDRVKTMMEFLSPARL